MKYNGNWEDLEEDTFREIVKPKVKPTKKKKSYDEVPTKKKKFNKKHPNRN